MSAALTRSLRLLNSLLMAVDSDLAQTVTPAGPDSACLDSLRGGDHDAWTSLFEAESTSIYRYALSRLGRPEDAEEVTSQTFEAAWKGISRYRDEGLPLRAWLFGIARKLAGKHRRRFMARNSQVSLDALEAEASTPTFDPRLADLAAALESLEPRYAEVISLRFLHGLSIRETAAVLKASEDGIKGRQRRALEALRQRLDEPC